MSTRIYWEIHVGNDQLTKEAEAKSFAKALKKAFIWAINEELSSFRVELREMEGGFISRKLECAVEIKRLLACD